MTKLTTPCGEITITDANGNLLEFELQDNLFRCDYSYEDDTGNLILLNTPTNYAIVIPISALDNHSEYRISLAGCKMHYGCSDEHTECVSGRSNGFCIAIGAYDINDDEKISQMEAYWHAKGYYGYIQALSQYDERSFHCYDVEMLDDYSGFRFHLIDRCAPKIEFTVAWMKITGDPDYCEDAVEFWTT